MGEINYYKNGSNMTIIEYRSNFDIDVKFDNGTIVKNITYKDLSKWKKINPFYKSTYNVGYLGVGKYTSVENGKMSKKYIKWRSMMKRCYDEKFQKDCPSYVGCNVDEEWHNFQNFAQWFDENYYEIEEETMCLDKDILVKGNKIYSPNTCIIVPERINNLFTKNNKDRGKYPIGVTTNKTTKFMFAQCKNSLNKLIHIGAYNTPEDAFYLGYKPFKEKVIKEIADEYKEKIPKKVYDALYRYEVEITD